MKLKLLTATTLFVACYGPDPAKHAIVEHAAQQAMSVLAPPEVQVAEAATESSTSEPTVEEAPKPDPYVGWEGWCEDIFKMSCTPNGEPCPADRTGRAQYCGRPGWARREGANVHECRPRHLNKRQRNTQRDSQGIIIQHVCQPPKWWKDFERDHKGDPSNQCWRLRGGSKAMKQCLSKHFCDPNSLHKLMRLIAARESTWDNETTHELNPDRKANYYTYSRAKRKGWFEENPHFHDADRWMRGYGWYGMNAALFVGTWDKKAPPEILCREVESTEIYLRKARRSFKRLWRIYGDAAHEITLSSGEKISVKGVTWYDVHRAVSGGKLSRPDVISTKRFVWRAKQVHLDAFQSVTWEMLATPIPKDMQNEVAEQLRLDIRNHFKPPAEKQGSGSPERSAP